MRIHSSSFENNQPIPSKHTCDGENISPQLSINGVPEEAKDLVLIMDDPDAPGGTFVHWLVWNINPHTEIINEGIVPSGAVEGMNDFGKNSYGGPCPPSGTHNYHFKLYALDLFLDLDQSSRKDVLEEEMEGHIIDWTKLVGTYTR